MLGRGNDTVDEKVLEREGAECQEATAAIRRGHCLPFPPEARRRHLVNTCLRDLIFFQEHNLSLLRLRPLCVRS